MLGKDSRFIEALTLGMWQANCVILGDEELGGAVVVDPGQDGAEPVMERLEHHGVRCEAILLTHGHLDHIWSVPDLAARVDCPILLHDDDRWLWDDPASAFGGLPPGALEAQFGFSWDPPTDRLDGVRDAQTLSFAGFDIQVRHTPGHTPGSSVYLLRDTGADDPLLLSGDLIFKDSVGRTDFPRGSWEQLLSSIQRVVLPLPDETLIVSGHGPETTVGRERRSNPFVQEIA